MNENPTSARRSDAGPGRGPAAHEDLTIEEEIRIMKRLSDGRISYEAEDGSVRIADIQSVKDFLRTHGAIHPTNYLEEHGRDWKKDLFR